MNELHGPYSEIPEFTAGIGYGMMFTPCEPRSAENGFQIIGTAIVTGPDVHEVTIYQNSQGYFYG